MLFDLLLGRAVDDGDDWLYEKRVRCGSLFLSYDLFHFFIFLIISC